MRFDGPMGTAERMRGRVVYGVSLVFILIQMLNWVSLYQSYNGFHVQHLVSLGACVGLGALIVSLRYTRRWWVYGAVYGGLLLTATIAATFAAAHPLLGGGINTSLLPLIVMGPVIIGLVSGWREVLVFTAFAALLFIGLFVYSQGQLEGVVPGMITGLATSDGFTAVQSLQLNHYQRFVQGGIALVVTGVTSAGFSWKLYEAFDELDAALAKAQRAEAAKGDFLAQMSHEIRTPLNGVISMSDLLTQQELPPSAAKPAEIISTASQHLMDLVNDVLDTARLEAGRLEITTAPFDLQGTLEALLDVHRQTAEDKGLWLGLDWQTGLPGAVIGDEARVRQVVANFVSNALKFTQAGGVRVAVRGAAVGETVRLKIFVQDTGTGIAAGELGGVFERYVQSASGRAQGAKGTGLGLAITRELAELMGGSVGVTSRVGEGSCFHVALDLARADAPAPRDAQPEPVRELTWLERRGSRAA